MKAYLISFAMGLGVGLLYALLRVKSPAPPLVALIGLLGMVLGEEAVQHLPPVSATSASTTAVTQVTKARSGQPVDTSLQTSHPHGPGVH